MAPPLVNRNTGDIIPASDHNDKLDYIEYGTHRVNTKALDIQGQTIISENKVLQNVTVPIPTEQNQPANKGYVDLISNSVYNNPNPTTISLGGILAGTVFNNVSFEDFVDMLLYPNIPVLNPNFINPSFSFEMNQPAFLEVGQNVSIAFTSTFNRGSINPQYLSESSYRSGLPSQYIYTGTGLETKSSQALIDVTTISYVVTAGTTEWSAKVAYSSGVQPKNNKGDNFDSPFPAGETTTIIKTITGIYPIYAITENINTMTKLPLVELNSQITVTMVPEPPSGGKQSIEFPIAWSPITKLEQWNTVFLRWEIIDLNAFEVSTITKSIAGVNTQYRKYTHIQARIGGRQLRWSVN